MPPLLKQKASMKFALTFMTILLLQDFPKEIGFELWFENYHILKLNRRLLLPASIRNQHMRRTSEKIFYLPLTIVELETFVTAFPQTSITL